MRLFDAERYINRRMNRKRIPDLKPTGEPHPVKVGRGVRRGPVAKVPLDGNSVAGYPTAQGVSRCLPGGSRVVHVHPQVFDGNQSLLFQPLICHAKLRRVGL